ncbi:hypothetical protein KI387_041329, partial [Taxus chinensis]
FQTGPSWRRGVGEPASVPGATHEWCSGLQNGRSVAMSVSVKPRMHPQIRDSPTRYELYPKSAAPSDSTTVTQ